MELTDDLKRLLLQLSRATSDADAYLIATQITTEVAELYGSAAIPLFDALMDAWGDLQRARARARAARARQSNGSSSGAKLESHSEGRLIIEQPMMHINWCQ